MRAFKHVNASTVDEVVSLLATYKDKAVVIAGGTDLLGGLKDSIYPDYPELVISLKNIQGLSGITEDNGRISIGALARLYDIEKNHRLQELLPALAEAAHAVASPQIRHMGTIGGNICQDNRCWYYRHANNRFYCLRKGGRECNALLGENQYHSIYGAARIDASPCTRECPAGVNIPVYMEAVRKGDLDTAARELLVNNPIPAVTGRVCPHFCQEGCSRQLFDSTVAIGNVERFMGDYILDNRATFIKPPEEENGRKVAVVGSGPAGLSAAFYLRRKGYAVTVFERREEIGGLLMYGIPPYRLPRSVVRRTVTAFEQMGIAFKPGTEVGRDITVEDLARDYEALFLACGAWVERKLGIEGEELLLPSLDNLAGLYAGQSRLTGKQVAVVGGGNAAVDMARVLLRLGAEPTILYRRSEKEMPAIKEEIDRAKEEGVKFSFLTQPVRAEKDGNSVALTCLKMRLGAPDETGRAKPEPVDGSEYTTRYDAVYKGIGQAADTSFLPRRLLDGGGLKAAAESTRLEENIFAGGDFVSGPATVVEAMAAGRKAALAIESYLNPRGEKAPACKEGRRYGLFSGAYLGVKESTEAPELTVAERIKSLDVEDVGGLPLECITEEANRCFNCGCLAVSPSDMAPALVALQAVIKTTKRSIPAEEFFVPGPVSSTALEHDEFVTEVEIPAPEPGTRQTYLKFALRKSIDFPIIGVAAVITYNGEKKVSSARIVLGGVAPVPLRAEAAEEHLLGKEVGEGLAEEAAALAVKPAAALPKNAYKIQITRALVKRAILTTRL